MGKKLLLCRLAAVVMALAALPAAAATPPVITEFTDGLGAGSDPTGIASGPDGNIWFTDGGKCSVCAAVGWATTAGVITELPLTFHNYSFPDGMSRGAAHDPNLWFADWGVTPAIGHIALDNGNALSETSTGLIGNSRPKAIVAGADGNLWFADAGGAVGRITSGTLVITELKKGLNSGSAPNGITAGADGNLWFTDPGAIGAIGRITPVSAPVITEFSQASGLNAGSQPLNIAAGADGNLWFTDQGNPAAIGRITTAGVITEFTLTDGVPVGIARGPDGNIWFTVEGGSAGAAIGRITASGAIMLFSPGLGAGNTLRAIVTGPDGNLWFTDQGCGSCATVVAPAIGQMTLPTDVLNISLAGNGAGEVTSPLTGVPAGTGIACGNGNTACGVSFTDGTSITLTATAASGSAFVGWQGLGAEAGNCTGTGPCTVPLAGNVDSLVTATFASTVTSVQLSVTSTGSGTVTSSPSGIACGTTCNASFASGAVVTLTAAPAAGYSFAGWSNAGCVGVETCVVTLKAATTVAASFVPDSTSDIVLVASVLPSSRSVQVGAAATVFGTVINASQDTTGTTCTVQPATGIPAGFSFQTTSSTTNAPTGTPNTAVSLAPGAVQSFVLALTPTAVIAPTEVSFSFACANATAAAVDIGLNTLLLSAATTPTPDIIALSATATNDGIVDIPGNAGTGAFVVATINLGSASPITVSANIGTANLPVALSLCETVPATGQCMAPPAAKVTTSVAAEATPTFAVFVQGNGTVPFQPAANRVFVQFQDAGSAIRGLTSVAVRTQ
jgi:virginiamycin B lyase